MVAAIPAIIVSGILINWLEQSIAPGVGWLWLWSMILLGGVGLELLRRWRGTTSVCAPGPRIQPLQMSALALQALGVLCYQGTQTPAFAQALPMLTAAWLPLLCVVGGMLGLGLISLSGTCRDEQLRDRV